jgi:hypothetical protein
VPRGVGKAKDKSTLSKRNDSAFSGFSLWKVIKIRTFDKKRIGCYLKPKL